MINRNKSYTAFYINPGYFDYKQCSLGRFQKLETKVRSSLLKQVKKFGFPELDKDTTHTQRKSQSSITNKHRCKNTQQNISKPNSTIH